MLDTTEERLSDLERLVLRRAERLNALEERLELAQRLVTTRAVSELKRPKDEAA